MESEAAVITADQITIHTPTPIQMFMDIPQEQIWAWVGSTDTALIMLGIEPIHAEIHACQVELAASVDPKVLDKSADLVALDKSADLVALDASMVRVALAELVELAILARLMMATTMMLAEDN